jgi:hypothetical protein
MPLMDGIPRDKTVKIPTTSVKARNVRGDEGFRQKIMSRKSAVEP